MKNSDFELRTPVYRPQIWDFRLRLVNNCDNVHDVHLLLPLDEDAVVLGADPALLLAAACHPGLVSLALCLENTPTHNIRLLRPRNRGRGSVPVTRQLEKGKIAC